MVIETADKPLAKSLPAKADRPRSLIAGRPLTGERAYKFYTCSITCHQHAAARSGIGWSLLRCQHFLLSGSWINLDMLITDENSVIRLTIWQIPLLTVFAKYC